jgi:WD40 repeat protein
MRFSRILIGTCAAAALLVATIRPAAATGSIGDLYVTSDASNLVRAYDGTSGLLLGVFTPSVNAIGQLGIHFGATNDRVLVGSFGGGVDEFVASTGAYIKTYSPGGGVQWAGVYGPNGNVYIGSWNTNDVREYDVNTGAFVSVLTTITEPADMEYGPSGHLYICSYGAAMVKAVHPVSGAPYVVWNLPVGRANDVAFLSGGRVLVTAMGPNLTYVYGPPPALITTFAGTGWARPHGIEISPHTGNILAVDGVTTQVHEFDPTTYAELNANFLVPNPGDKIVDLDFRPESEPTPADRTTWGRLKGQYR